MPEEQKTCCMKWHISNKAKPDFDKIPFTEEMSASMGEIFNFTPSDDAQIISEAEKHLSALADASG